MPAIAHENKILGNTNNLNELSDVNLTSPTDKQGLVYDAATGKWVNADVIDEEAIHWSDNAVLGAKNLLPNEAISQTVNGVTFTKNADETITANGTATATPVGLEINGNVSLVSGRRYKIYGLPANATNCALKVRVNGVTAVEAVAGGEAEFDYNGGTIIVDLMIRNKPTLTNVTVSPIITLATDTDDTYVPYAMTNRELTESLKVVGNVLTVATSNDIEWKYADARANDTVIGFKGFVQLKRDATASENSWITIGTISKTPTWWSQNVSTKLAGTGTAGDSTYQITASGEVQFNIRAGMKTGDQYLITGTNIL